MTEQFTQQGNSAGLAVAREVSLGVLPGGMAEWSPRSPNSYKDFGASYKSKARNPINASRQSNKAVTVDRDAAGGWQEDLTYEGFSYMAEALLCANYHTKGDIFVNNITAADGYKPVAGGAYFHAGDIIVGVNFANAGNNGRKVLAANGAANAVAAPGTVDEANSVGYITKVGHIFAAGDISFAANGAGLYALESVAGALAALGVIPGETIFIGDDNVGNAFDSGVGGFCRVAQVSADGKQMVLDKVQHVGTDAGAAKAITIYVGRVLHNESDPNLIRKISYACERTLGKADDEDAFQQAEYIHGALIDQFDMPLNTADKITTDYTMTGTKYSTVTSEVGPLPGTRLVDEGGEAFTTSNDMVFQSMNIVGDPNALYAYLTDVSMTIKNNVSPNKALGILGAFDLSLGDFAVSISCNAYFANISAQEAIAQNDNVTFGFGLVRSGKGIVVDLPLVGLGDGKPKVASNNPITVALTMDGARASLLSPLTDYTLMIVFFDYLPVAAHGAPQ